MLPEATTDGKIKPVQVGQQKSQLICRTKRHSHCLTWHSSTRI